MRTLSATILGLILAAAGCSFLRGPTPPAPCWSEYHAPGFETQTLARVMLLPLANESQFPQAAEEIRRALAAELQSFGCFEVLVPPPCAELGAASFRVQGRFNEAAMIELMHMYHVDGVVFGAVTQYHPYAPPRIGLSLQMVSPAQAVVVASVDGLWDARHKELADRARDYYGHEGHWFQSIPPSDLAVASPQLYQRFVCHQAALALTHVPPPATAPSAPGQPVVTPASAASGPGMKNGKMAQGPVAPAPNPTPKEGDRS
jgi:hypothetical protein